MIRNSDSWDLVDQKTTLVCGYMGHAALMSAELVLAGSVEEIGDKIIGKIAMQMDRSVREAEVTERARMAVQISSMCVMFEVSSSIFLLLMLLLEMHLGDDNLGNAALSRGLGGKVQCVVHNAYSCRCRPSSSRYEPCNHQAASHRCD